MQKQFRILGVTGSGYYDWLKGKTHKKSKEDCLKEKRILEVFELHKRRYGGRRIVATLAREGLITSRFKVSKILSHNDIRLSSPAAIYQRPRTVNTIIQ